MKGIRTAVLLALLCLLTGVFGGVVLADPEVVFNQGELETAIAIDGAVIDVQEDIYLDDMLEIVCDVTLISTTDHTIYSAAGKRHIEVKDTGSLTLGPGAVLDGQSVSGGGIVGDSGSSIHIAGGIVQNCVNDNGGGVHVTRGTLKISAGAVRNNKTANSGANGAGIYAKMSDITMTGGEVSENGIGGAANCNGGGIYLGGSVGELDNLPTLILSGGEIRGNEANSGGGVYLDVADMIMSDDARITENSASHRGGGIAVVSGSLTIQAGEISGNDADVSGGGISCNTSVNTIASHLTITGGKISENRCLSNSGSGGGIFWKYQASQQSQVRLSGCEISDNTSQGSGGGALFGGWISVEIADTKILHNIARGTTGGLSVSATNGAGQLHIGDHVVISENEASQGDAGLSTGRSGSHILETVISGEGIVLADNIASGGSYGGASLSGGKVRIQGTLESPVLIQGNYAEDNGGGIGLFGGSTYEISNVRLEGNEAAQYGGGVYGSFSGNTDGSTVIENCVFIDNTAKNGGAMYSANPGYEQQVEACTFEKNGATNIGGGLYIAFSAATGSVVMDECRLTENTAVSYGGGLYAYGPGSLKGTDCTFEGNSTSSGGGIYLYDCSGGVELDQCTLTQNRASGNGGAIYMNATNADVKLDIKRSDLTANTAGSNGGVMYVYGNTADVTLKIEDSALNANTAGSNGGVLIGVGGVQLMVEGGTFDGNTSGASGGAIYNWDYNNRGYKVEIHESAFTRNRAGGSGGAIYNNGTSGGASSFLVQVKESSLLNNVAADDGGGLYVTDYAALEAEGVRFSENVALNGYSMEVTPALQAIHQTNIDVTALSLPMQLGRDYAYNNYDVNNNGTKEIQVIYKANGGTGPDYQVNLTDGTHTVVTAGQAGFTWTNHQFLGWSLSRSGPAEAAYDPEEYLTGLTKGLVLYAVWEENAPIDPPGGGSGSTYTVTFHLNDGSADDIYLTRTVSGGGRVSAPTAPQREGYIFGGWYLDEACTQPYNFASVVTGNLHLYAKWSPEAPERNPDLNYDDHYAYLIGYGDNTVRPQGNITRAEVATILFRLITDETRAAYWSKTNPFDDVEAGTWYNNAVSTMASMGVLEGYPDGSFRPGNAITRGELATMLARLAVENRRGDSLFNDIAGHWAETYIDLAGALGWVEGYGDGAFRPDANITRAEVATMVNRLLERVPEEKTDLLEAEMHVWSDNRDTGMWYYIAIQEASNTHEYERKADGYYETWTALGNNPNWEALQADDAGPNAHHGQ